MILLIKKQAYLSLSYFFKKKFCAILKFFCFDLEAIKVDKISKILEK